MIKAFVKGITTQNQRVAIIQASVKLQKLLRSVKEIYSNLTKSLDDYLEEVKSNPHNLNAWVDLTEYAINRNRLSHQFVETLRNHDGLGLDYATKTHFPEILKNYGDQLKIEASKLSSNNYPSVVEIVMLEIIKHKTIYQCRDAHTEGDYYKVAEQDMDWQWEKLIYPEIQNFDFSHVLELAPGHGRNTNKLRQLSKSIVLVDVNKTCIDACRERFGESFEGCSFTYHVNNGSKLEMIPDGSITTVYSFDSMVHFDKTIVREYLREFKRILAPNGKGFLHHSNYGSIEPNSDWAKNPGNRSDLTADLFKQYASEVGLSVVYQKLHGINEGRHIEGLDCVSVIFNPSE